jgi:hypothetical protein
MRGSIVHNQDHRVDLSPQRFGNDLLEKKGLKIGEVLARATGTVDLSISHGEPGKQMPCPATRVSRLLQLWMTTDGRPWGLFAFACLDPRFLVQTHRPGSLSQQAESSAIHLQDRTGPLQKLLGIVNMLPGMIAPRADALGEDPAAYRAG